MATLFDDASWRSIQRTAEQLHRFQQQIEAGLVAPAQSIQQMAEMSNALQQHLNMNLTAAAKMG